MPDDTVRKIRQRLERRTPAGFYAADFRKIMTHLRAEQ